MLVNARNGSEPRRGARTRARRTPRATSSPAPRRVRRHAAQDLRDRPDCVGLLCGASAKSPTAACAPRILTTLIRMKSLGGRRRSRRASAQRERGAAQRGDGGAQDMPGEVEPVLERLLDDPDADVRIFVANILSGLAHPRAPNCWRG